MNRLRATLALAAGLALVPAPSAAQTVLVRVLDAESSMPVFGALAYLDAPAGGTVKNALTDERGRALFVGIPAGTYTLRVEMIGKATVGSDPFEVGVGMSVSKDVRLAASAIQLEGISVEAEGGRCRVRPGGEGMAIADVWDEARKALEAASFTDEQGSYRYETMIYNRSLDRNFTILDEEERRREGYMLTPFESRPAEDLVANGFVQDDGPDKLYFAPDADVLLSDPFLDTHCFRLERGEGATAGMLGLAFEPTGENRRVPDIAGTLWIDERTAELQWLEYRYQYLDPDVQSDEIGGRVDFRRMPAGTWIVPEWWIRMPAVAEQVDGRGLRRRFVNGYVQTGGLVLEVREAGGRRLGQRVETGGFEGVVMDSVGVPIPSARVGVVGSNQQVFTDAAGRYSITGLNPGRYQVRFIDPTLELVGFVPPAEERDVIRGEMTELDVHMPSVGDVLFELCRDVERDQGHVILAGFVRDRRGRPVPNAAVRVDWLSYDHLTSASELLRRPDAEQSNGVQTTADDRGFYHFCAVPPDTRLELRGASAELESGMYELRIAVDRFAVVQPIVLESNRER